MRFENLRSFLEALRKENQLKVISAPVDPNLELAEIHRRVIDEQGPALLFTNVKGASFPVVTNLFGTSRRVDLAFGPRPEQLMKDIIAAKDTLLPPTPKAVWDQRQLLLDLLKVGTKNVSSDAAPVLQQCKTEAPLAGLPVLTSWQEDGGPFVTLPLVYTEHPENGNHNLGMYRMQVYDDRTTGMHWQIHKGGGFHYHEAEKRGQALPVTVFLGGPPALIASAIAPVPEHLPELLLTSLILGQKLPLVANPHGGHRLVAEAEFAICGSVAPHVRRPEGPFGDHFGYYSLTHDFPVFNVSHVWHRKDAIYPATIVGKPRQEDYYLGEFLQKLLSPAFPMAMPGVKDLWTYAETGFHALAAAIVRESYSREAIVTAFRILGEGQLSLTKVLMVTDRQVELERFPTLLETVLERFDPLQDLYVFANTSNDTLDYTGDRLNHGSKAVLVGVGEPKRELPAVYMGGELPGISAAAVYCRGCLVVSGASYTDDPRLANRLAEEAGDRLAQWPLVIVADETSIAGDQTAFLWTVFTRFNPAADIYARTQVKRHHIGYELPLVIDARMKPGYPDELFPREDIVKLVDSRWSEYFA
ncbi:menaquinone biosynthesis decarboxylase, SCO4490 family [Paenibacillus tianmuensis]|uniref:Menaquinone biosynthesis decarboxylase, SCO4490 family n=1 Tax=Paenibacillus tianmuensis TaxID=624147 RepID=A0A1G4PG35_9BACL|nr:UbiD family decarboxylase [Paenibacillus tianmuensis]SCW30969.1 menaquinone biosynthesis decarboxylase, SCO4490 family [Paenibacillus tianmuensis]